MNDRSTERAERALRAALGGDGVSAGPDPVAVRRRVRDRRVGLASVAAALTLIVTAVGFGVAGSGGADTLVAAPSPVPSVVPTAEPSSAADPAPGWRVEYFRDARFEVPDSWGYQFAPGSDWCADSADGKPAQRHRSPYVALGEPAAIRLIGCPVQPASLLTEHAQIRAIGPAEDYGSLRGVRREGSWWVGYRLIGGSVLTAVSADQALVERILDSAGVADDPPCAPGPEAITRRPADPWTVGSAASTASSVVVCQYDIAEDQSRSLRAVARLDPAVSQRVIAAVAAAPVHRVQACETPVTYDLALVLRVTFAGEVRDLHLSAGQCGDGRTPLGGFDDGTDVRLLTRAACAPLMTSPILYPGGGTYVAKACG